MHRGRRPALSGLRLEYSATKCWRSSRRPGSRAPRRDRHTSASDHRLTAQPGRVGGDRPRPVGTSALNACVGGPCRNGGPAWDRGCTGAEPETFRRKSGEARTAIAPSSGPTNSGVAPPGRPRRLRSRWTGSAGLLACQNGCMTGSMTTTCVLCARNVTSGDLRGAPPARRSPLVPHPRVTPRSGAGGRPVVADPHCRRTGARREPDEAVSPVRTMWRLLRQAGPRRTAARRSGRRPRRAT